MKTGDPASAPAVPEIQPASEATDPRTGQTARSPARQPADQPEDAARAAILDVTYGLLEERGYASVTTDDIASEARVSKTTLYRRWRTKQQLVVDAARMHFGTADAPEIGSFRAEVHWILENRMREYRSPETLRLVGGLVGAAVEDPQLRELFAEWVEQLSASIRRVLERGIRRGDVRSDIDLFACESLIAGIVARTVIAQQSFSADAVHAIVDLITAAAAPRLN